MTDLRAAVERLRDETEAEFKRLMLEAQSLRGKALTQTIGLADGIDRVSMAITAILAAHPEPGEPTPSRLQEKYGKSCELFSFIVVERSDLVQFLAAADHRRREETK